MSLDLEYDADDARDDVLGGLTKDTLKNHVDGLGLSALDSVLLLDESWDEWDDDLIEAIGNLEVDLG